jgi:hypothetical protein
MTIVAFIPWEKLGAFGLDIILVLLTVVPIPFYIYVLYLCGKESGYSFKIRGVITGGTRLTGII